MFFRDEHEQSQGASFVVTGDRISQLETGVLQKFGAIELILDRTPVSHVLHSTDGQTISQRSARNLFVILNALKLNSGIPLSSSHVVAEQHYCLQLQV